MKSKRKSKKSIVKIVTQNRRKKNHKFIHTKVINYTENKDELKNTGSDNSEPRSRIFNRPA